MKISRLIEKRMRDPVDDRIIKQVPPLNVRVWVWDQVRASLEPEWWRVAGQFDTGSRFRKEINA